MCSCLLIIIANKNAREQMCCEQTAANKQPIAKANAGESSEGNSFNTNTALSRTSRDEAICANERPPPRPARRVATGACRRSPPGGRSTHAAATGVREAEAQADGRFGVADAGAGSDDSAGEQVGEGCEGCEPEAAARTQAGTRSGGGARAESAFGVYETIPWQKREG